MWVNEKMLFGMARLNKVFIERNGDRYTLYKNERDRIHDVPLFSGTDEQTYWKLVQVNKEIEERNK